MPIRSAQIEIDPFSGFNTIIIHLRTVRGHRKSHHPCVVAFWLSLSTATFTSSSGSG